MDPSTKDYLAAYDAVLAQWPVPVTPVDVRSAYGTTRVNICGPADGTPLVLLHGGGATSTVWFANVGDLTRTHRVYAVDRSGRSVLDGAPFRTVDDLMAWLDAVLDGLGLGAGAALCGHSYGGWMALRYALYAPHRVHRLAVLDSTDCFGGMRLAYRLRAVPLFVRPSAQRMRSFLAWETRGARLDPAWLSVMALGVEQPGPRLVLPRRPADERFAGFSVPTLLVLAGRSRAHDIRKVGANARRLVPHIFTAVLPDATHHTIPTENAAALNQVLCDFLAVTR